MARRSVLVTIAVATLMVATVSIASAAPGGAIYACVNNNSGEIKIASGPGTCKANERELSLLNLSAVSARLQQLEQQIAALQAQISPVPVQPPPSGTPGATITVGTQDALTDPPMGPKLFVDGVNVQEGFGEVTVLMQGPSFCSAHGTFVTGASIGQTPLRSVQCGRAGGQTVSISGCTALISVHGYLHIDSPYNFMGMSTLDLQITQTKGSTNGTYHAVAYTARGNVQRGGPLTDVHISSCA